MNIFKQLKSSYQNVIDALHEQAASIREGTSNYRREPLAWTNRRRSRPRRSRKR